MFVDDSTWERLSAEPLERDVAGHPILIPQPAHLIALKLHAASSPERHRTEMDWEAVMDETEPLRTYYLEHFDSPEKRLREKNGMPFRMG